MAWMMRWLRLMLAMWLGASSGGAEASAFGMPAYMACGGIGPEGASGRFVLADFEAQGRLAGPAQVCFAEEVW
jgi:hypothetical protein